MATSSGWLVRPNDPANEVDVIPLDDLRPHEIGAKCWCNPEVEIGLIAHNAMDKREEYENGRRFS